MKERGRIKEREGGADKWMLWLEFSAKLLRLRAKSRQKKNNWKALDIRACRRPPSWGGKRSGRSEKEIGDRGTWGIGDNGAEKGMLGVRVVSERQGGTLGGRLYKEGKGN